MHNPTFQSAQICTLPVGSNSTICLYSRIYIKYLHNVLSTMENFIAHTILGLVSSSGRTNALHGWTSCQEVNKSLITIMCLYPQGIVFLDATKTSLKDKSNSYLFKLFD